MTYPIDTNIPLPEAKQETGIPFSKLRTGHSFFVPLAGSGEKSTTRLQNNLSARGIHAAKMMLKERGIVIKFTTKKFPDGVRVWCVSRGRSGKRSYVRLPLSHKTTAE